MNSKEVEIVEEANENRLDILGISSTKKKGKGSSTLKNGWQRFYSGVDPSAYGQAGVLIMVGPNRLDYPVFLDEVLATIESVPATSMHM